MSPKTDRIEEINIENMKKNFFGAFNEELHRLGEDCKNCGHCAYRAGRCTHCGSWLGQKVTNPHNLEPGHEFCGVKTNG